MFGRQYDHAGVGGVARARILSRLDRARRREQERADAELAAELRWQWRTVCQGTPLAQMLYTPSGATRAIPMIDHIDLGPPITLTVRMRAHHSLADFVAAAPTIAPALGATALEVHPLVQSWLRIVLVGANRAAVRAAPPATGAEELRFGA